MAYLVVFGGYMFYEFMFNRADSSSHTIAIIAAVVVVVVGIPLGISVVRELGTERRYVQKHGFNVTPGETVYPGGKRKPQNPAKKQRSKSKKRK